jgi:hypothetical protein
MRFDPLNEDQLALANLLQKGQYRFKVLKAEDKVSQAGNEMIFLKLGIRGVDDKVKFVFCNLLEAMPHLVKHFCDTTGQPEKYMTGNLNAKDCDGKDGYVEIDIAEDKQNKVLRNIVKDFIIADKYKEPSPQFKDDTDIPW